MVGKAVSEQTGRTGVRWDLHGFGCSGRYSRKSFAVESVWRVLALFGAGHFHCAVRADDPLPGLLICPYLLTSSFISGTSV